MNTSNQTLSSVATPIEPDQQAIMALRRVSTGADVHDTNELIHIYCLNCAVGKAAGADEAKRNMYRRARELMRRAEDYSQSTFLDTRSYGSTFSDLWVAFRAG